MPECVHFAPPTPHSAEFDFREVPPSTVVPEGEYPLPTLRSVKEGLAPVEAAPPSLATVPESVPTPDQRTPSSRRSKVAKAPRVQEGEQKPSERGAVSSKTRQRREP
jgi:hypothetical protein